MTGNLVQVDALDVIDHVTVHVHVTNVWRLKLGVILLKLAACVLKCRVDVTTANPSS